MKTKAYTFKQLDIDFELPIKISDAINPERVIRFIASDDTIDRYNEVILPIGWDVGNYTRNPVVMEFHDQNLWPIGKAVAIGVVENQLLIDCEFDPADIDTEADKVFKKIKHGTISAGSVGFMSKKSITPSRATESTFAKYPGAAKIYTETELLEWTICPVPANPAALAAALQSNINDRFIEAPSNSAVAEEALPNETEKKIDEIINRWRM